MKDIDTVLSRNDINQILEDIVDDKSEELKELMYDTIICALVDVLKAL